MRVFMSRYTPGLKPGMGEKIGWNKGDVVLIISGIDKGRRFKVLTEGMSHDGAPGKFIREGYFLDDPSKTRWAKLEESMWFDDEGDEERHAGMASLGLHDQ